MHSSPNEIVSFVEGTLSGVVKGKQTESEADSPIFRQPKIKYRVAQIGSLLRPHGSSLVVVASHYALRTGIGVTPILNNPHVSAGNPLHIRQRTA